MSHHFSIVILTIGIPGAGKTMWVKNYVKDHPTTFVVSSDELRRELTGQEQCVDPSQNDWIHNEAYKRVKEILDDPANYKDLGPTVIVDSTNTDINEWIQYKHSGASILLAKVFDVSVDEAMQHQMLRARKVPEKIVEMKWKQLQENKKFLPFFFNMVL